MSRVAPDHLEHSPNQYEYWWLGLLYCVGFSSSDGVLSRPELHLMVFQVQESTRRVELLSSGRTLVVEQDALQAYTDRSVLPLSLQSHPSRNLRVAGDLWRLEDFDSLGCETRRCR
jgi:hypothetical protein